MPEPERVLGLAQKMREGSIGALGDLRKTLVDVNFNAVVGINDNKFVAALYIGKCLVDDVWFNLAQDASFDFPTEKLDKFTKLFGMTLVEILSSENNSENAFSSLGESIVTLHSLYVAIENNPSEVLKSKGGPHGVAQ